MRLDAYLQETGQTLTSFAQKLGVSHPTVVRYLSGERTPNRKNMQKIKRLTDGQVTANDFFHETAA